MTKQNKKRAVVVCPGRGTYNKPELGYLQRYHTNKIDLVAGIDQYRQSKGQASVSELDQQNRYNMQLHTAGENASALIYACAAGDFADIDKDEYDIVAVTGNSMGWYIALAVSQALNSGGAIELINTMGSMMTDGVIGGQIIYPVVDEHWRVDHNQCASLEQHIREANDVPAAEVYMSIFLGGYWVLGGNEAGLKEMEQRLPRLDDTYPMRLFNHAAFHTPMLKGVSEKAKSLLSLDLFDAPSVPLIDGAGHIWQPFSTDPHALREYTLAAQVFEPYDFSKAIEVALKEFAPDKLIVLGPGATLGGAIGQEMIRHNWQGLGSKSDFIALQKDDPYLLAMGMEEQRNLVVK